MAHMHTLTRQTLPDRRHKEGDMNIMLDKGGERMSKGRTTEQEREVGDKIWDMRWRLIPWWAFTATDISFTLTGHHPTKVEQDAQLLTRCLCGSHNTKCKTKSSRFCNIDIKEGSFRAIKAKDTGKEPFITFNKASWCSRHTCLPQR